MLAYQDYNQLFIHINLIKLCSKLLFLLTVVFVESNISCPGIIGGIVFGVAYSLGLATLFLGAAAGSAGGSLFGILIGIVAGIASIWFSLAQGVKRLHDLNKSGWLILICCVPIIGWVFSLYMLFADGTVGPNQYGEDPKNRMPYQPQPTSVNVTVNVSRETPAEASAEEEKTEKAE